MSKAKRQSLRKIPVDDLRLGMYVAELCGSWMDHPFWSTRFLLDDPADLARIRASAIREIWIDTALGLDVVVEEAPPAAVDEPEDLEATLGRTLFEAAMAAPARVELAAEVTRAAAICGRARQAVTAMFSEARMGRAVTADALHPLVEEISGSVMRNPGALVSLARLKRKDDYTYMHSVAVCGLMIALARQLGLDDAATREAGLAGLVHDIGKAMVPLEILNKPGKLTDAEFDRIKEHPGSGYDLLLDGAGVSEVPLDVCLHHHEKTNGSGYPKGLDASGLSLFAKMGAVCDVYDAITSDRPYKAGWDPGLAIRKMNEWSDGHFEPRVFQAFVKTVGIYPVGSLVRLESGLLAVILESNADTLLKPMVKAFYCTRRERRVSPVVIDLAEPAASDSIAGWEDVSQWQFPDFAELWSGRSLPAGTAA
jgi:HD-GYP domain-containing protein (c-di-GMP phosphodiesterase class II)